MLKWYYAQFSMQKLDCTVSATYFKIVPFIMANIINYWVCD